jgi:hypothetical protein
LWPRLCEKPKTIDRDRTSYSFKAAFGAHTTSPFNFEIEPENIILVALRLFEFPHSLGPKRRSAAVSGRAQPKPLAQDARPHAAPMGKHHDGSPPVKEMRAKQVIEDGRQIRRFQDRAVLKRRGMIFTGTGHEPIERAQLPNGFDQAASGEDVCDRGGCGHLRHALQPKFTCDFPASPQRMRSPDRYEGFFDGFRSGLRTVVRPPRQAPLVWI